MSVSPSHSLRCLVCAALALAAAAGLSPAFAQLTSPVPTPAVEQPVVACSYWRPSWQTTPLPNGRALPYILIPLDANIFRGCGITPVLAGGLPVVRLSLIADGRSQELNLTRETAGPPYPAPPTARVFWQQPAGHFPRGSQIDVYLQASPNRPAGALVPVQTEWLKYEMPGGIPTIDRSGLGPVETSGSANYIPNQLLLTGATKPAYHGTLRIVLPSLSPSPQSDQVYIQSDNLLSTQNLDDSAGYSLALGVQHNLPSKEWDIAPNNSAEILVRSNQAATDQSVGLAAGSLILGRDWRGPIGDRFLYAAATPELQIYPAQFTDFVRRDLRLDPGFTERAYYDPSAELVLAPFFIGLRRGQTATLAGTANLSFDVKGWYVTGLGAEYRYVVRLQVPVRIWLLQDIGISYFQGADDSSYFRYENGVGFDATIRHF